MVIVLCQKKLSKVGIKDAKLREHIERLITIYACDYLVREGGALVIGRYCEASALLQLKKHLLSEVAAIRPQMLNLIEAFDIPDEGLMSAIGHSDGNVYDRLWECALSSKINRKETVSSSSSYINCSLPDLRST